LVIVIVNVKRNVDRGSGRGRVGSMVGGNGEAVVLKSLGSDCVFVVRGGVQKEIVVVVVVVIRGENVIGIIIVFAWIIRKPFHRSPEF
jgi:hypothetical protein